MSKFYSALGKNVFVKEIIKENKVGDFIIPDSIDLDFTFGEVVSCSDGYFEDGRFVQSNVKIGDSVVFAKISGTKMMLNGEKLIRVYMSDIIAKEIDATVE